LPYTFGLVLGKTNLILLSGPRITVQNFIKLNQNRKRKTAYRQKRKWFYNPYRTVL